LSSLKFLNIESNQFNKIPSELSQCPKLKELRFKSNPLKDNRLKKLMEQEKNESCSRLSIKTMVRRT